MYIKNKLHMIYINDIMVGTNCYLISLFNKININLQMNCPYIIKYKQKTFDGNVIIYSDNINRMYDGKTIIVNYINTVNICTYNINSDKNSESEFILLLCKSNIRNTNCTLFDYINNNVSIILFHTRYDIYMMFQSTRKEKVLNKSYEAIIKSVSYHLPIHFVDCTNGKLLVDIYNIYPYINIVFRKLIYGYESISLIQTIKCNCKKVPIDDSFNKAINPCQCFMKENMKRIQPFYIDIKDLDILLNLLKYNKQRIIINYKNIILD